MRLALKALLAERDGGFNFPVRVLAHLGLDALLSMGSEALLRQRL